MIELDKNQHYAQLTVVLSSGELKLSSGELKEFRDVSEVSISSGVRDRITFCIAGCSARVDIIGTVVCAITSNHVPSHLKKGYGLYYIVAEWTNQRLLNIDGTPTMWDDLNKALAYCESSLSRGIARYLPIMISTWNEKYGLLEVQS